MRFTTYTRFKGSFLDAVNLEGLLEHLSDFLMEGGFAGGPHFHPYWGWSGLEDTSSTDSLRQALLKALLESGQLTPEMIRELRGEGESDEEARAALARLLDDLIQRMVDEGYLTMTPPGGGAVPGIPSSGEGSMLDEARRAALGVEFQVTRKGMDFLGYRALRNLLGGRGHSSLGSHETSRTATGVESSAASRPYAFGDTLNLDIPATLRNAIARQGETGPGEEIFPLELDYRDLMVHQTEYRSSCATVLLLDVSHSMILYGEDRFAPAKRVALALSHLIRTHFPGDTLQVVTFGDRAEEIPLSGLPRAQVGPFHTNTAEGLEVARRILRSQKKEMRQIIMVTDGKPSAMTLPGGQVYTNSGGLDPHIMRATFREIGACRKAGIPIHTFMLARDRYLVDFVRQMAEIARGKAYFTSTRSLGEQVMMDFMKGRRRTA